MSIEQLRQRWTVGCDQPLSAQQCPKTWQPFLQTLSPDEISLGALGLLSHQQALTEMPEPPTHLTPRPLFPILEKPTLPVQHWQTLTHLLQSQHAEKLFVPLLRFLATRGYSLPAQFWHKYHDQSQRARIPVLYSPWLAEKVKKNEETLTAENWGDFSAAEKLQKLKQWRTKDPAACRELIEQCIGQEKAPQKLKILEVFAINFSAADLPFLSSLQKERSEKVRKRIELYLLVEKSEEKQIEKIKTGFYVQKSLLTQKRKIHIKDSFHGDIEDLHLFFKIVDLNILLKALEVSSLSELLERLKINKGWPSLLIISLLVKILPFLDYKTLSLLQIIKILQIYRFVIPENHSPPLFTLKKEEPIHKLLTLSNWEMLFHFAPFSEESISLPKLKTTGLWKKMIYDKQGEFWFIALWLPQSVAREVLSEIEKNPDIPLYHPDLAVFHLNAELNTRDHGGR